MSFANTRENSDFKSIINNWNNFLIENKIEEDLSLKIEKILSENKLFVSNENILNPKNKNIRNNNLNEGGWLSIIGTGILVLPTVVKIVGAVIDTIKGHQGNLSSRLKEAFDEDFGHQAIPLKKALKKKNSKIYKFLKTFLSLSIPDEPVHVHSTRNDGKEYVIVYGKGMSTEEKDKAIEDYDQLHAEEAFQWGSFRKVITSCCNFIHHSVQNVTELIPRLIMKAFNKVTKTEHNEIKEVIISVLGNILTFIAVFMLISHALTVMPTLGAAKAGAEGAITVVHLFELTIEAIELMMEAKLIAGSTIKIWNASKKYLDDTALARFLKNVVEGGKSSIKSLISFLKSLFDSKDIEYTEESQ